MTVRLPVLPLDDEVVLPGMVVPVDLTRPDIRAAVEAAQAQNDAQAAQPGIRTPKDAEVLLTPRTDGSYGAIGTRAAIEQIGRLPNGKQAAVVRADARMRIGTGVTGPGAALWVEATEVTDETPDEHGQALATELKRLIVANLHERGAWQIAEVVEAIEDAGRLADQAGYAPYLSRTQKQQLLETLDVTERLELALQWTKDHIAEEDVADSIRKEVQDGVDKQQREFLLRRQLEAVKKELSELDGTPASEEEDYRDRVEAANLPEKVHEAAIKEVDKLERTSEQSPEGGWIRTWLDTVLEIPWNERTEDVYDIAGAREILDADHAGLSDVKDRIIEYLAVRKRRDERGLGVVGGRRSSAVLALVGPPGVGKTSLGESVARSMGRKFVRVALGGVRDEAEIRGHRRTYVAAMPGRIIQGIRKAGTNNPVF
ncbi:MAG TPA: LON peptidase substrate-binding domain-containing protein, partial [Mycobacteriales bacterium]|nr:LON peptidase substrate-binding domain-containing protein [Mycobacteriales bacterium]